MNWWKLRAVGNLAVLKVSYIVLIVAPLLSEHEQIVAQMGLPLWLIADVFFASLSLALANLFYDVFCPVIVKRFASPNDLYAAMLDIKKSSRDLYPDDDFDASLDHCKQAYADAAAQRPVARRCCATLYIVALVCFTTVFAYRTWGVMASLVQYYIYGTNAP